MTITWQSHDCHVIVMWLQCSNVHTLIDSIETTYFYKVHFSNRFIRHTTFSSVKCLQPESKTQTSNMSSITLYTTLHHTNGASSSVLSGSRESNLFGLQKTTTRYWPSGYWLEDQSTSWSLSHCLHQLKSSNFHCSSTSGCMASKTCP